MQLSETSIKLLENELGYSYYEWERTCDEEYDQSNPTLSKRKEFEIKHLKKKFDDWMQLVHELGLVVILDEETTSMYGQTTFNIMTKEWLDTYKLMGFKVTVIE